MSKKGKGKKTYQLTYRNIPRMSTSLVAALTIGTLTSAGPRPTSTITPPDLVAYKKLIEILVSPFYRIEKLS